MLYSKRIELSPEIVQGKMNQSIQSKDKKIRFYRTYLEKTKHMNVICAMDYYSERAQQLAIEYAKHSFKRFVDHCVSQEAAILSAIPSQDDIRFVFKECLTNAFKYSYKKCMDGIEINDPVFYETLIRMPSVVDRINAIFEKDDQQSFGGAVSIDFDIIPMAQRDSLWCTISNTADISDAKMEKIDKKQVAEISEYLNDEAREADEHRDEGLGVGLIQARDFVRSHGGAFVWHRIPGTISNQAPVVQVEIVFSLEPILHDISPVII
jgi:signal transduction histidine kinase